MKQGRVAQRYAEALLDAATDGKAEKEVSRDLEMIMRTIDTSKDFELLLKSPVIKQDKKRDIFKALFEGKVSNTTLGFLDLLAEKGRESALAEVIVRFRALQNQRLGILNVSVTSAAELSRQQHHSLQDRFTGMTGKKILMDASVDAALMGGFLARVGDTVFDGSIKRQLEIMRQRFREGNGSSEGA